jgi:hypothetical protein
LSSRRGKRIVGERHTEAECNHGEDRVSRQFWLRFARCRRIGVREPVGIGLRNHGRDGFPDGFSRIGRSERRDQLLVADENTHSHSVPDTDAGRYRQPSAHRSHDDSCGVAAANQSARADPDLHQIAATPETRRKNFSNPILT